MKFLQVLIMLLLTHSFVKSQELPVGIFQGAGFSLEKNGISIFSDADLHYHNSYLKINKISDQIYEFTISIYLQQTRNTRVISDIRIDKYEVVWKNKRNGKLINKKLKYKEELSEFLLEKKKIIIKSQNSKNGMVETHVYRFD